MRCKRIWIKSNPENPQEALLDSAWFSQDQKRNREERKEKTSILANFACFALKKLQSMDSPWILRRPCWIPGKEYG
jgi:hypothetical protein